MSPRRLRTGRLLRLPGHFGYLVGAGVLGSAGVAAALNLASGPKTPTSVLGSQVVNGNSNGDGSRSFLVSGDVDGLAPGVTRTLLVKLSNPNQADISVESLTVAVGTGRGGCPGSNLEVGALTGPVFVPGGGTAQVSLPVTMLGSAPGICQGATFPLTYGGSAVKAA